MKKLLALAAAAIALSLSACGSQTPSATASASTPAPAIEAAATSSAAPSPTPTGPPKFSDDNYKIECGTGITDLGRVDSSVYTTFQDVWADPKFATFQTCEVSYQGQPVDDPSGPDFSPTTPFQHQIVDMLATGFSDHQVYPVAFGQVLDACLIPSDARNIEGRGDNRSYWRTIAKTALTLCPDAAWASELKRIAAGTPAPPPPPATSISQGNYVVGTTMAAGTWKTTTSVSKCYWERTTPQGATIANDFITFASDGATVTVQAGEGFTSRGCGDWTKVG